LQRKDIWSQKKNSKKKLKRRGKTGSAERFVLFGRTDSGSSRPSIDGEVGMLAEKNPCKAYTKRRTRAHAETAGNSPEPRSSNPAPSGGGFSIHPTFELMRSQCALKDLYFQTLIFWGNERKEVPRVFCIGRMFRRHVTRDNNVE